MPSRVGQQNGVDGPEPQAGQRLQEALSAGQVGDWSWNATTDLVKLGPGAAECFGLPAAASTTWTELRGLLHEDDRGRVQAAVDAAMRDRSDYNIEYRVNRTNGQAWLSVRGRAVIAEDGQATGMIGVVQDITDRKTSELAQQRLAAVVESSADAIISKDLTGIIQTWNSGAQRIFGYTAEEMIGKPVLRLIPRELHSEEERILQRQRRGERIEHYETVRVTKDGRLIDVSLTVSPIRDRNGTIIGASKVARDITARKRADQERRKNEQILREESRLLNLLNETGKSIAAELDAQKLAQTVVDATTQLSGAEFGAFLHKSVRDEESSYQLFIMSGGSQEHLEKPAAPIRPSFPRAFKAGRSIRIPDLLEDDRSSKWLPPFDLPAGQLPVRSYLAVPVISRHGDVLGGLFFSHSKPGVFSERIERLVTGIAAQAAVALDNAALYEDVKRAAEAKEALLAAERSARSEAERVNFMKDEFLATLSHELRTPLNAIVGWAQVLRGRGGQTDPEVLEGLTVIDRNARVQAQLIEDLLDMSRIISGKVRLEHQRVDVHDVVRASVAAVRHLADAKHIDLQVELATDSAQVWGDPNRLQQCSWNLLSNAIKFTPKGGTVRVTVSSTGHRVALIVSDTGHGIDPAFLPHMFERFRQADSSSTRYHGGLGLGLSIVKSLVELHGGSVEATSPGRGQGATFCISLPEIVDDALTADGQTEPLSLHPAASDYPSLEGLTVLVVDDEPDALGLVKRVLGDCGARVLAANSAQGGLELLQRERPDVLISDIGMPDEDGYTLIRKVRALKTRQGGRIPAAALSAFARPEDRTRALRSGYQMHLSKPVDPTELTAVVASLAARKSPVRRG